jgi:ubiquinone/menaquinone biosynthesis C-methylase UbiE
VSGDYASVTEVPGVRLTREATAMMYTRYNFAAELARGRDALEVGCGAGQGLGLIARRARRVVAGDFTSSLVLRARRHYAQRVGLLVLDATALPFRTASFDVAFVFEAIYYFPDASRCIKEGHRVLRPGGQLVICSVNRHWRGFNASPHSVRYYDARELKDLLEDAGFRVELLGAYREDSSARSKLLAAVRSAAVALRLVPRTMKGKELLKRVFYGRLEEMPAELASAAVEYARPLPLADPGDPGVKVVYAVGTR